jgi:hypothetical protein
MTLIRANAGVITQINVFEVPPGGQQALIDHLAKAAAYARQEPGWISANLHRSLDGTRVVNYAQTESLQAAQAVIERLRAGGYIDRNRDFGEAHPGLYEVAWTLER